MLSNPLKMVIFDLDDTFWSGTLSEGAVVLPKENLEILETLNRRGIVCSICSKNNHADAQRVLEEHGAWFYFVFPHIEFSPKGEAIARLIEQANLRPENVLFIDDNRLNLEEARFHLPQLMTADPREILPHLLGLPQAQGKNDEGLTRLHQYKQLENKVADKSSTKLSNEEFLRQCDIRVEIDINVEPYLERVIELINRSNQLNFTKKRIETEADVAEFKAMLGEYGTYTGVVKASDKYGDYDVIGFFLFFRRELYLEQRYFNIKTLVHFVFSCRIMGMGIEQYVYQLLGRPTCKVVAPVSSGLNDYPRVDWIEPGKRQGDPMALGKNRKSLIVGGCDLMQMSSYCSSNCVEYVNRERQGNTMRYDDAGFVLSSREALRNSTLMALSPSWTREDAFRFDQDLQDTEIIIATMWGAMEGDYMLLEDEIMVRLPIPPWKEICKPYGESALSDLKFIRPSMSHRLELAIRSFDRIASLSPRACKRFIIGMNTRRATGYSLERRLAYNSTFQEYCKKNGSFEFISIDDVVPEEELIDTGHYTRKGFFALSCEIIRQVEAAGEVKPLPPVPYTEKYIGDVVATCPQVDFASVERVIRYIGEEV